MKEIKIGIIHDACILEKKSLIGMSLHFNHANDKIKVKHFLITKQIQKRIADIENNEEEDKCKSSNIKSNFANLLYHYREELIDFEEIEFEKMQDSNLEFDKKIIKYGFSLLEKENFDIVFIATKFGGIKYNVNKLALAKKTEFNTCASSAEFLYKLNRYLLKIEDDYTIKNNVKIQARENILDWKSC